MCPESTVIAAMCHLQKLVIQPVAMSKDPELLKSFMSSRLSKNVPAGTGPQAQAATYGFAPPSQQMAK